MAFEDILGLNVWQYWYNGAPKVEDYLNGPLDIDLSEPDYSFGYVSFWVRKDNGQILYAMDSGYSCPMPYEDTKVSDLKEISFNGIPALLDSLSGDGNYQYNASYLRKQARENLYPWLIANGANGPQAG